MRSLITFPLSLACSALFAQFGELDPTFGGDGIVQTVVDVDAEATAIAVQSDGRILVAGTGLFGDGGLAAGIVRYMPDGTVDQSFGDNGMAEVYVPTNTRINDLQVLPDGRILALGESNVTTYYAVFIARLMADGTLDTTFGLAGTGVSNYSGGGNVTGHEFRVLSDGSILIAGHGSGNEIHIHKLTPDGDTDASFGTGGQTYMEYPGNGDIFIGGLEVQPDGKFVVGATAEFGGGVWRRFVCRRNPNGGQDYTFEGNGQILLEPVVGPNEDWTASDVLLLPNGRFLIIGSWSVYDPWSNHVLVTRLMPDGTLDTSFGTDGEVIGPDLGAEHTMGNALLLPDGDVLFIGTTPFGGGPYEAHRVWRMNADGVFDPTWGDAGVVTDPLGPGGGVLNDLAVQADGKVLICGRGPDTEVITVARLTGEVSVGLDDNAVPTDLAIYPVPVFDQLSFSGAAVTAGGTYIVRDMTGRVVLNGKVDSPSREHVDVSALGAGLYHLELRDGQAAQSTARFIKGR